jgi:hypothetical protein
MKAAIMQPYFLPYIGYFQLISCVDLFIVYDNIEYTKKGWINRNRLLKNGTDVTFTIPLKNDSDFLQVRQREVASDFRRDKLLNQIVEAYRKAPQFQAVMPLIQRIVSFEERNLFRYVEFSIAEICRYAGITTRFVVSSALEIDHSLKSQEKVIAICKTVGASHYVNPIGGVTLYSSERFRLSGIDLSFLKCVSRPYAQFGQPFVASLSILDVLMFNAPENIRHMLKEYELFEADSSSFSGATFLT